MVVWAKPFEHRSSGAFFHAWTGGVGHCPSSRRAGKPSRAQRILQPVKACPSCVRDLAGIPWPTHARSFRAVA